jgi:hypothetical protein
MPARPAERPSAGQTQARQTILLLIVMVTTIARQNHCGAPSEGILEA